MEKNYNDNPYHNFNHAVDVTLATLYIINNLKDEYKMTILQKISFVIAALLHDIDHFGLTGGYVSTYKKNLINTFGNNSTLEKHHVDVGNNIINMTKLLKDINFDNALEIKRTIQKIILCTDPSINICNINSMYSIIIRCADICSVIKNWNIHKKVSYLLYNEFYNEGNILKNVHNISEINSLFDIEMKKNIPNQQIMFFENYVEQHYCYLSKFIGNYEELVNLINNNKSMWNNMSEQNDN